jgi:hypothetical protein
LDVQKWLRYEWRRSELPLIMVLATWRDGRKNGLIRHATWS